MKTPRSVVWADAVSTNDRRVLWRGLLAFFLFTASEWAAWVAVLVYAFGAGGAASATVATLAQLTAAAVAAPGGAAWLAAQRHEKALRRTFLLQALALLTVAIALWLHLALVVVVVLASIATAAITLTRPVYFSMLAHLVRDDAQLARANGASTVVEGLAILAGPALAGVVLAADSAHAVLLFCATTLLIATLVIRDRQCTESPPWFAKPTVRLQASLRSGISGIGQSRDARTVLAGVAGGFFLVGSIDILAVVFASETLRLGPAAPGTMISALGAGAVLGAGALTLLAQRHRFSASIMVAVLLASVPFAMTAISPGLQSASLWLVAAGIGKGMLDVTGRTVLQQRMDNQQLTTAFGCQECMSHLALACGALFALPLVTTFGTRGAFVATAAVLPIVCLLAAFSIRNKLAEIE